MQTVPVMLFEMAQLRFAHTLTPALSRREREDVARHLYASEQPAPFSLSLRERAGVRAWTNQIVLDVTRLPVEWPATLTGREPKWRLNC